jgi:hypothetical protein
MARLGYGNCVGCHLAPQGGGLLTEYGRGIDEAQSARAAEYQPSPGIMASLTRGRLYHDVRSVTRTAANFERKDKVVVAPFNELLNYRAAYNVTESQRIDLSAGAEIPSAPTRPPAYLPSEGGKLLFLNRLNWEWRPWDGTAIIVGRDYLPTGVNISDLNTLIRSLNREGLHDHPIQEKFFVWGDRYLLSGFGFLGTPLDPADERESGGGGLFEYDLLGEGKTVVGISGMGAKGRDVRREKASVFTRLGFGRWGLLAEHDATRWTPRSGGSGDAFYQFATYGQLFLAAKEWLVLSLIGEHLSVQDPFLRREMRLKPEVAMRFTNQITLVVAARYDRSIAGGKEAYLGLATLALKSVE